MKKLVAFIFLFFCFSAFYSAFAAEEDLIAGQMEKSGVSSLLKLLPEEGSELFSDEIRHDTLSELSLEKIFSYLKAQLFNNKNLPLKLFSALTGAMLLSSLFRAFSPERSTAPFVSSLAIVSLTVPEVTALLLKTEETAASLREFIVKFIPVFGGVCAVSGKAVSAVAYEISVLSFVELYSALAKNVILPISGIALSLSVCGCFSEKISIEGLTKLLKSFCSFLFVGMLTLFSILVSAKTVITSSADAVTVKTMKFLTGSLIPVVGSSLNDAYSTVYGCLGVVKSTVGLFGILAILLAFLQPLVEVMLAVFSLKCAAAVGELLGQTQAVKLLEGAGSALSMALGVIFSYEIMTVISVTIMLITGGG